MSYKNQERLPNGRFGPKKEVVKPTVKKTRVKKEKPSSKPLEVKTQFNVFVLDDTSSMQYNRMVDSTVNGYNEALKDLEVTSKKHGIEMFYGLSKFGHPYNEHFSFSNAPKFIDVEGFSQGRTALYDGIGYAIKCTDNYLRTLPKNTRVVLTILTDGDENASKLFTRESIEKLITNKISEGWTINFIGGGDSFSVKRIASRIGIFESNTLSYSTDSEGAKRALDTYKDAMTVSTVSYSKGADTNIGFFS